MLQQLLTVWEDAMLPGCRDINAGPAPHLDFPPKDGTFWQQARISGDKVFDPSTQRCRTLLILRAVAQRVGQEQRAAPPLPPGPQGGRPPLRDKIGEKLSGYEPRSIADTVRHVRETSSDNDGPCPVDATILPPPTTRLRPATPGE